MSEQALHSPPGRAGDVIGLPVEPMRFQDYDARRTQGSVSWDDSAGAWIVPGYEECEYVERNESVFAQPERPDLVPDPKTYEMIQEVNGGSRAPILLQGEQHQRVHRAISRSLAQRIRECQERELRPLSRGT
jgi:cytochrome P450